MRYKISVEVLVTLADGGRRHDEVKVTYGKSARNWSRCDFEIIEKYLGRKTANKNAPCANDVSILSIKDIGGI